VSDGVLIIGNLKPPLQPCLGEAVGADLPTSHYSFAPPSWNSWSAGILRKKKAPAFRERCDTFPPQVPFLQTLSLPKFWHSSPIAIIWAQCKGHGLYENLE